MKHFDQATLDKLLEDDDEVQLTITSRCKHRQHEDLDFRFACGLNGGYDTCKCELGVLCDDFEPDEDDFDQFFRDVLGDL